MVDRHANQPSDLAHGLAVPSTVQAIEHPIGPSGPEQVCELSRTQAFHAALEFFAAFDRRVANQLIFDGLIHGSDGVATAAESISKYRRESLSETK